MHTIAEVGSNIPAFLIKLWNMVEDPSTDELISWSSSGTSFAIKNQGKFARDLLPMYYKHNNMASFIRQLNMYDFHKLLSIDSASWRNDRDQIEFMHSCFLQGQPYLLENIKRKIVVNKVENNGVGCTVPQVVGKALSEVKLLKGRQESLDTKLAAMKMENESLWRELASLRQKHNKQQQIVNKLIQFLVTLVQPSRHNISVKRRGYPLMLSNNMNVNRNHHIIGEISELSPSGPTIQELDPAETLLDQVELDVSDIDCVNNYYSADGEGVAGVRTAPKGSSGGRGRRKNQTVTVGAARRRRREPKKRTANTAANPATTLPSATGLFLDEVTVVDDNGDQIVLEGAELLTDSMGHHFLSCGPQQSTVNQEPQPTTSSELPTISISSPLILSPKPDTDTLVSQFDAATSVLKQAAAAPQPSAMSQSANSPAPQSVSSPGAEGMQVARKEHSNSNRLEMDSHVDTVQSDLDALKELLNGEGLSLDANTLLGLFNEDPMTYNMTDGVEDANEMKPVSESGNELMAYSQNMADLTDILSDSDWNVPLMPESDDPLLEEEIPELNTPQMVLPPPLFPQPKKRKK